MAALRTAPIESARTNDVRAAEHVAGLDGAALRTLTVRARGRQPPCFREAMVLLSARLRIAAAAAVVAGGGASAGRGGGLAAAAGGAGDGRGDDPGVGNGEDADQAQPMEQHAFATNGNGAQLPGGDGSSFQRRGGGGGDTGGDDGIEGGVANNHLVPLEKSATARALIREYIDILPHAPEGYAAHVPLRWVTVAREAVRLAVNTPYYHRLSLALILPLRHACEQLQAGPETVAPLHTDYLALCIHAKAYDAALFFDGPGCVAKTHYEAQKNCLSAADVLCKHYYLAVIYIARRCYARALQQCRLALAVPSTTLCDVAVAVYRKYILVSLLHTGSPPSQLKISSYAAGRLRSYATEYSDLAKAYTGAKFDDLHKLVASHKKTFEEDSNGGLVRLIVASLPRRAIVNLTSSFVTLSLEEVASRARLSGGAEEAEAILADMSASGAIRAKIDAKRGVVRFTGDEEDNSTDEALAAVVSSVSMSTWGARAGDPSLVHSAPVSTARADSRLSMDESVGTALAYVERIQEFRNAVLCDSGFVLLKMQNEREFRSQAGDVALAMEEAEQEID